MQTGMVQQFCDSFLVYMQSPEYQTEFMQAAVGVDPIEILYQNIYQAFRDPNKQATAILELTTMKQGSKSAEEHVQCFKQAYGRSGYQETAVPELPTTLDKWYELIIRLDRQWRQAVAEKKIFAACGGGSTSGNTSTMQRTGQQGQSSGNTQRQGSNQQTQCNWQAPANRQNQPQQWRPPTQPVQWDPNAMQVNRNHGAFRCYNCGQTGHMAHNCPNPRNQQMHLMNTWNGGTDDDREELWRMVTGGSSVVGGSVTCTDEAPSEQLTVTQNMQTAPRSQNFPFGQ
ncbi:hypothetical protein AMATHDRAFT_5897 [Amanita thiersii Skay4041]|uniref:CCHC-type domain-containing protein n=1 Tax=Amanita thiersii Skay4041 TaxID=703135 RepID=A0A2A9NE37_9AGAR|nr:hypothetical protein AMATHDRAFT_5897 [Amanita thiersii Skay4041]